MGWLYWVWSNLTWHHAVVGVVAIVGYELCWWVYVSYASGRF